MRHILKQPAVSADEHLKYRDPDFSDLEIEIMLKYFNTSRYEDLKSMLETRKKSFAIAD